MAKKRTIYGVWTLDDVGPDRGSFKVFCSTRKKAEKELEKLHDAWCSYPPKPDNLHIREVTLIED